MRDAQAKLSLAEIAKAYDDRLAGEPVTRIADALGLSRQGLYRQWRKWGFDISENGS
jgi:transcriptional regulator of acetoin/glycerol metabolism